MRRIDIGRNSTNSQQNTGLEQDAYAGFGSGDIVSRVKETLGA